MPKRVTLNIGYDTEFIIIGISSHLKGYKLLYLINDSLKFKFNRIEDFLRIDKKSGDIFYPVYKYYDTETRSEFCLISNHNPDRKLIPELKQIDYLLITKDLQDESITDNIVRKIKQTPRVLTAYRVEVAISKNLEILLNDLEVHLISSK